jgi:hypothetical protein
VKLVTYLLNVEVNKARSCASPYFILHHEVVLNQGQEQPHLSALLNPILVTNRLLVAKKQEIIIIIIIMIIIIRRRRRRRNNVAC